MFKTVDSTKLAYTRINIFVRTYDRVTPEGLYLHLSLIEGVCCIIIHDKKRVLFDACRFLFYREGVQLFLSQILQPVGPFHFVYLKTSTHSLSPFFFFISSFSYFENMADFETKKQSLDIFNQIATLPCFPDLSVENQLKIIELTRKWINF